MGNKTKISQSQVAISRNQEHFVQKNLISPVVKSKRAVEMENTEKIWKEIVKEWRPKSETFFLRMSTFALPLLSTVTAYEVAKNGFQLNYMMKGKNNFRTRWFVTYVSVAVSGAFNILAHRYLIVEDVLLQKTQCPMCVFTRGMGLQLVFAQLLPATISAFGANMSHFRRPGVNLIQGMTSTLLRSTTLLLIAGFLNMSCSFISTYKMQNEWFYIKYEMAKFEKAAEEKNKNEPVKIPKPILNDESSPYVSEKEAKIQSDKLWKRL